MKLKLLLILIAFGLGTNVQAQMETPCQTGQNQARFIISNGSVYFPRLIMESSLTLRKMVELDFGIKDEVYNNGSCVQFDDEAECFYELMKTEIEKKWGKDFLKAQRKVANKLDKDGIGYIEPKENGIGDSISNYLTREHLFDLGSVNYDVALKISADNEILDIAVFWGVPQATEISRNSSEYMVVTEAVNKMAKVYQPGQLRGKPIESTLSFWVECR